jgi:glycosyltransferase involved in cell wall biosynthesis
MKPADPGDNDPNIVPDIAVVIPSYQRAAQLPRLLREMVNQTLALERFEVIVVDDCSVDDTVSVVEEMARLLPYRLRVIRTPRNHGPAAARNLGWRATAAPVVAFLDDDCTPSSGWLEAGLGAFDGHPRPGIVQGATLLPKGADTRVLTDWWICRHVVGPTPLFEGGNLFFPREVLMITGGFDEEIQYYGEDCAAGWRVLEAGFDRAFCLGASVTHPLEHRGFRWYVKNGYLESRIVHCAAKHPGFRKAAFWRSWAFRKEDPAFLAAVAGAMIGLRYRPALLMALPYLWWRRPSIRRISFFRLCLQVPVVDAARIAGHIRGSILHRVFVL